MGIREPVEPEALRAELAGVQEHLHSLDLNADATVVGCPFCPVVEPPYAVVSISSIQ